MNLSQIHRLTETATFCIYYDVSYNIVKVEWSDNFRYLLGYNDVYDFPDDIKSLLYSLHHEDYKLKEKLMKFAGLSGRPVVDFNAAPQTVEFRVRRKNNEYMWLRGKAGFYLSDDPQYYACLGGLFSDVTKEKEAASREVKTRRQLNVLEDVVQMADIGIWEWVDVDGKSSVLYANKPYRQYICGEEWESANPRRVFELWKAGLAEEDMTTILENVQKMKSGAPIQIVYSWNHPTKGKRLIRTYGASHYEQERGIVSRGYIIDVTDSIMKEREEKEEYERLNRKLEEALVLAESANKAKTIFLNNMSHDIRTPMNAILGFAELIGKNHNNPVLFDDYLSKIKSSGKYLLDLINNVLDMARIDSGKTVVNEELTDVCDKDMNVNNLFTSLIEEKNLHLTMTQDIKHRYAYLDRGKIHQVVVNLLSNAIKYTPKGGNIDMQFVELPCEREGYGTYSVIVQDNGIGMSKEFAEHIFDNFSRERTTTESKVIGTGLGMSIAKKLCDLMGGTLEVETELGKGTKFTFTLMHRLGATSPNPSQGGEQPSGMNHPSLGGGDSTSLEGKRILLTEDNEINAEIAEALLSEHGLLIDHAENGKECINMLLDAPAGYYDLILMDIQMPVMNGYDAARNIRALEDKAKANIPIIAMTANAFDNDRQQALASGMNDHLAKPIDMEKTLAAIRTVLS